MVPVQAKDAVPDWSTDTNGDDGLLGLTILTTLDPMRIEEIGTLEAKTNLSALLNQVLEGKSFYLTRRGKRIAELRPVAPPSRSRQPRRPTFQLC